MKDPAKMTDAEKMERFEEWALFGASAGTYEVKGNTLITRNIVPKYTRGMSLTEEVTFKLEGDSFVVNAKPGIPNGDRQTTYTRVRWPFPGN